MIRIVTDSVASIPGDVVEDLHIDVMTMYVNYRGCEYEDATMDVDAFYEKIYDMVDDIPTSSQPSQANLEALFEEAAEAGDEVLGVFMSPRMSGTLDGVLRVARSVSARHADFRYRIIDSTSNSFDEAYAVFSAVAGRDAGCTLQQCADLAVRSVESSRFLFTPESLRFLKAGGRIGGASALLGSVMKICPILTVSDGEATTFTKVRTRKKALASIAGQLRSDAEAYSLKHIVVHYIGSSDEARQWAKDVIEPLVGHAVPVIPVSPVIGVHVGPAVGIAYECDSRLPGKLDVKHPELVYAN